MSGAHHEEQLTPGPGERAFVAMRDLCRNPEEFAAFTKYLHQDGDYRAALQMCMNEPAVDSFRLLYRAMREASERYVIRRVGAEIRQELAAAEEPPSLFAAAGVELDPPKRQ